MEEAEKQVLCTNMGARVRAYRKQSGMSRERLAEALGISTQYVSDIEQGRKCMSAAILVSLGRVFGVSLDTLAKGAAGEDAAVDQAMEHLMNLSPLERGMAAHMILTAAKAVEQMGREH